MKNQTSFYNTPFPSKLDDHGSTIRLPAGVHRIEVDTTLASTFTLKPDRGAVVYVVSGKTLTLNCAVELMAGQTIANTFTGSGTVVFAGPLSFPIVMTSTQRNAISGPSEGVCVYDTTLHKMCFYNGTNWQQGTSSNAD